MYTPYNIVMWNPIWDYGKIKENEINVHFFHQVDDLTEDDNDWGSTCYKHTSIWVYWRNERTRWMSIHKLRNPHSLVNISEISLIWEAISMSSCCTFLHKNTLLVYEENKIATKRFIKKALRPHDLQTWAVS